MTEALLLVVVGSLVPVSAATLVVAVLALRKAQLYVESVEQRLESFHESQILLLGLLRERGRSSEVELAEDPLLQERDRLALAVHARRSQRRGIDESRFRNEGAKNRSLLASEAYEEGGRTQPRAANFPDTASSPRVKTRPGEEVARRAVWHPHPDDDVSPTRASEPGDAAVEMFRRHYDKYLENYEGYVKLAARLYRMRDEVEAPPSPVAEREWDGRLRRVIDGIQRTTARLDILEEYNPELATDDRISRRAAIARSQRELQSREG